jgi:hypothetical protein
MGDINPHPSPTQFLGSMNRRATATKRIKHDITGIGGRIDDAFQQRDGLLRGIAEALLRLRIDGADVTPIIANWHTLHLV